MVISGYFFFIEADIHFILVHALPKDKGEFAFGDGWMTPVKGSS
jgi:hypothetical protein